LRQHTLPESGARLWRIVPYRLDLLAGAGGAGLPASLIAARSIKSNQLDDYGSCTVSDC